MAVKRTNPFKYCESVPDSGQVTASSLSYYGVSRPLGPWKFLATQVAGEIWEQWRDSGSGRESVQLFLPRKWFNFPFSVVRSIMLSRCLLSCPFNFKLQICPHYHAQLHICFIHDLQCFYVIYLLIFLQFFQILFHFSHMFNIYFDVFR